MGAARARVLVADELRLFLRPRYRDDQILAPCDGASTLGHVIQSLGVPLTEVGSLEVNGSERLASHRPADGDLVRVAPVRRPQPVPPGGLLLDVHLGTLARRLRLLGIDTAYSNDADDDVLVEQANAARRLLLTQDRGLLCRRALRAGAYVHGARPDDQLIDVLDRFDLVLAPWTRCPACNGPLAPVSKASVDPLLRPGTRRTYQDFSRCRDCHKIYWHGAHASHLDAVVHTATTLAP